MQNHSNSEDESFNYTYSSREQEEVMRIRKKYAANEDKMERVRQLDRSVTKKGTAAALILGITGSLVLGFGMCCSMVWQGVWFIPGIAIGIAGLVLIGAAHPVYTRVTKAERERIAPEIIRLTDELLK